jgi:aryl-alcohol dehydrogenase-like predicted oxidoreductase
VVKLEYREFGKTGLKISKVGFGCWQAGMSAWGHDYTRRDAGDAIIAAHENGINFFDTAEAYGSGISEKILGESLKGRDAIIATKLAGYNSSVVEKSIERSFRNLGRTIDLYQVHWVPSIYTNLGRLFRAIEKSVKAGKVQHIGVSNFPLKYLEKAQNFMEKEEIVSDQVQYSIVHREAETELLQYCRKNRIEMIAWSPLARGELTGKYFNSRMPFTLSRSLNSFTSGHSLSQPLKEYLQEQSASLGVPIPALAIRYIISKGILPIPGAKNPLQARQNSEAMDAHIPEGIFGRIDSLSMQYATGSLKLLIPRAIPNTLLRIVMSRSI